MFYLIHRYIFKELFISISFSFAIFLMLLLLGNAFQDLSEMLTSGKLGFQLFLQLIILLIPFASIYAIPLSVLTGTLIAFGRLSSDSEFIGLKAAGISLYQIAASVFFISFIGMFASILVTLHYGPKSVVAYKELISRAVVENPLSFVQQKTFITNFPGYIIYINERDGTTLKDFWIWDLDENNEASLFYKSKKGMISYDDKKNTINIDLLDAVVESRLNITLDKLSRPNFIYFKEGLAKIPLDEIFGDFVINSKGYNNMTFAQLMEERESIINKENIIISLVNGDISKLNKIDSKKLKELSNTRKKIQLHVQRNLAQAYSVLALSIIAIPLSLRIGRKESYLNALIALFIALLYHFLFILMSWFDDFSNFRSDLLVWFPNILYQSIGMWLFAKEAKK